MDLAANALTTWEYAREYLGLDEDEQEFVTQRINEASAIAERHMDRALYEAERTEIYDGSGRAYLLLRQWPVSEVTSVRISTAGEFDEAEEESILTLDENVGVLWTRRGFPKGRRNVRVTYTAGFADIPADVQAAVCEIVASRMKAVRAGQIGIKSVTGDGVNTTFELTIPTNAQRILETYRREFA